jgi:hypothetical protein
VPYMMDENMKTSIADVCWYSKRLENRRTGVRRVRKRMPEEKDRSDVVGM